MLGENLTWPPRCSPRAAAVFLPHEEDLLSDWVADLATKNKSDFRKPWDLWPGTCSSVPTQWVPRTAPSSAVPGAKTIISTFLFTLDTLWHCSKGSGQKLKTDGMWKISTLGRGGLDQSIKKWIFLWIWGGWVSSHPFFRCASIS